MGKPGYVYQASNFLYGGFIWTQVYITKEGRRVHPRSAKKLLEENVKWKLKNDPGYFENKKAIRIYWLTRDFMDIKVIKKIEGKQFRYIYPLNKKARRELSKSKVTWTTDYPKDKDIIWKCNGETLKELPYINRDLIINGADFNNTLDEFFE